jgi:TolB-like protein/Tfp pilus assembly protein PilF
MLTPTTCLPSSPLHGEHLGAQDLALIKGALKGEAGVPAEMVAVMTAAIDALNERVEALGGDPEQEYFVDGVTESLTTDLSRISGAFVIARNTAFAYKGKAGDVREIGRDLNVRYALEGSVQRSRNRMRVNVQLIDAQTGSHLGERFDKPVAELFEMQDEIVSRLANRLGQELEVAEARRAERAANPDSMDHYFLGLGHFNKGIVAGSLDKARSHFDRALALDPDNVDALVGRATVDVAFVWTFLSADRVEMLRSAEADLGRALRLRPDSAAAHALLGEVRCRTFRAEQGIAECERALAIDRNFAHAHALIGLAKYLTGRIEETEAHVLEALRISPLDHRAGTWMQYAGVAKLLAGRDEEAVTRLNRSIELNPNILPAAYFVLAAALARVGRVHEARDAARVGLELDPGFTVARIRASPFSDNPIYLAGRERIYEGMRMAGVPEE